jgi:hypothetical protein
MSKPDDVPPHYGVAVRKISKADSDKTSAEIVRFVLREHLHGLKEKLDPATWVNSGWAEVEAFVEALSNGGMHPALVEWEDAKNKKGHPAPSMREIYARRVVVLMVTALRRTCFRSKAAARQFATNELQRCGVFEEAPSAKTLEYWEEEFRTLGPGEELLLSAGIAAAGAGKPQQLALFFVALCHLALNPTAMIIEENAGKGGGFFRQLDMP